MRTKYFSNGVFSRKTNWPSEAELIFLRIKTGAEEIPGSCLCEFKIQVPERICFFRNFFCEFKCVGKKIGVFIFLGEILNLVIEWFNGVGWLVLEIAKRFQDRQMAKTFLLR